MWWLRLFIGLSLTHASGGVGGGCCGMLFVVVEGVFVFLFSTVVFTYIHMGGKEKFLTDI